MGSTSTKSKKPSGPRVVIYRGAYVVVLLAVALVGSGFVALNAVDIPEITDELKITSFVCTDEISVGDCGPSNSVAQFSEGENRVVVELDEVSQSLIDAVIAAEDRSFFTHSGVDPWGIGRALYRDVRGSASRQGGSTITQQYVKITYLNSDQTITRKLKEAALAIRLEQELSKTEILTRYLNAVYFGRGAFGIEAAAQAYFAVRASELTVAQSAYLAGLLRAPERADAYRQPEEATRRRKTVLDGMLVEGYIDQEQYDAAVDLPWEGNVLPRPPENSSTRVRGSFTDVGGDYIIEWVRQQLIEDYGAEAVYNQGLRVYLTVNQARQGYAWRSVTETLPDPSDPSAALVSLDDAGRVVALVGGDNFEESEVNLALGADGGGSGRQAGSTFKAYALAAWVDSDRSVTSEIAAPEEIVFPELDEGEDWTVKNYEDEDLGITTVENATWHSSNTAYVQMSETVGPEEVAAIASATGISAPVPANSSTVLGTSEVSVLDMATSYSTFANRGALKPAHIIARVTDAEGNLLYSDTEDESIRPRQVIDEPVADTVNDVLTGVIREGTATGAQFGRNAAGKTGTTQDIRDAWFVGYTCRFTTAVWIGYPEANGEDGNIPTMENVRGVKVTGGSFPTQIWREYMQDATEGSGSCSFEEVDAGTVVEEPDPDFTTTTSTTTTEPPSTTTTTTTSTTVPTAEPEPAPEAPEPETPPAAEPAPADDG